ncbi:MAG: response regulator transcription factor [Actinomycetia bacterium]|nr:response regulator transcription factor [Actinomycetes bacterium]
MRVVIVDDDPFVCTSLQTILDAQGDIDVVAVGHDGNEAEQLYRVYQPDIVLADIQMPKKSGLDAAQAILAEWPHARIVLLTTFADDHYIASAISLGVCGYLIKQDAGAIAPALRLVMSGQSVLGSEVLGRIDRLVHGGQSRPTARQGGLEPTMAAPVQSDTTVADLEAKLTAREYQVAELVAVGLDNRQIAASLCISEGTVRNLVSMILQKLDLKNRTQLAASYYRQGGSKTE